MSLRTLSILLFMGMGYHLKADVYLIIYATHNGQTGHCGIAVDNYKIRVIEYSEGNQTLYRYDTMQTGTLTYYDLWPVKDSYKGNYDGDVESRYYKLPSSSWKQFISIKTLMDQGVPHKLGYPCDGIISIPSTKKEDLQMISYLDKRVNEEKAFNAMQYNCCDFVAEALTQHTGRQLDAKEFIIRDYVTTPNQMYKLVSTWPGITVLKDPGKKIQGTFVQERIVARFLPLLNVF